MRTGRLSMLTALALTAGTLIGCERDECTYDTDCREICTVCDTRDHICVPDRACEDVLLGVCRRDLDCDPINEFCDRKPGEDVGLCKGWDECPAGECTDCIDHDGDRYGINCPSGEDCDDQDPANHPGNFEICDGQDNDCNPDTQEEGKQLDCQAGELCLNGFCCQDECSPAGLSECADQQSYHICGNYDSDVCLDWSTPNPCPVACEGSGCTDCLVDCLDKQCGDDGCGGSCGLCLACEQCSQDFTCQSEPHATLGCHQDDVWWLDSCGMPEELDTDCGLGQCNQGECCTPQSCEALGYQCGQPLDNCGQVINCGSCTGCTNHCSTEFVCQATSHSDSDCYNGDVWWFDSCGTREELLSECGQNVCQDGVCTSGVGPLMVADLEDMDLTNFPGGDNVIGTDCLFRAKSYAFCPASGSCSYVIYSLGYMNSGEAGYRDGETLSSPQPLRFKVDHGPASQCGDPEIGVAAGEFILITHDGGLTHNVYLPEFQGTDLTLYFDAEGSSYYDQDLSQLAQPAP